MNWAAVSTVAVLLFLFGASLQISWQLENVLGQLGSQLEISVYLDENTFGESMQSRLLLVDGVASARLIPKEDAWQNLMKDLGKTDLTQATQQLGGNPLVDEFKVRAVSSDRVPDVGILGPVPSGTGVDANFTHLNIVLQKYRDMEGCLAGLAVSGQLVSSALQPNGSATPA